MPDPTDPRHTLADPRDPAASAAGSADETFPRGAGKPAFGPPAAAGEVGTLGPYRVVKELGKGGMGAVYLAVDTRLNRRLALKVIHPESAADREAKERFLREAQAAAQISHDNVVTVYEADERDRIPYIAMQFLQGYSLDAFLRTRGVPSLRNAVRIAREAALGLAAAHELGMVHRDVKPGNLWLEAPGGRVKVLDFGLAKPVDADAELTKSGAVVGTPAYMSPEQARGQKVDARSDLFGLGAVLYRLCAGRGPFAGEHVMAVLAALVADEPVPVRELNPQVPEPLARLIHQLLAKRPEHRPRTAAEVAARLGAVLSGAPDPADRADVSTSLPVAAHPVPQQLPVVVPMQLTARPEDVFAGLADEPADGDETEADVGAVPVPRRGGTGLLVAAGVAVLLAAVVVAVVVSQLGKKPTLEPQASATGAGTGTGSGGGVGPPPPPPPPPPPTQRPRPWVPPAPVGQSPFDKLDPAAIPKEELFDWQPKELVAVAGTHSPRTWLGQWHMRGFAISPDGASVACAGEFSPVRVWDVKTRTVRDLPGPYYEGAALAFSPDGRYLVTVYHGPDRYVRWDLAEPFRPAADWLNGMPQAIGRGILIAAGGARSVFQGDDATSVWDTGSKPAKELARFPAAWRWDVGVSRDGTRVALYSAAAKGVVVSDVTAAGAREVLVAETNAAWCALSPDGTKLVNWRGGQLVYWNLAAGKPAPVEFAPRALDAAGTLAFSPDGTRLVTQDADRALRLWDVTGPAPLPVWSAPLPLRGKAPEGAARVGFAGGDGTVIVAFTVRGFVHFIDASGAEPKFLNPIAPSEPAGPELAIDGATGRVALGRAEDDRRQFWDFGSPRPAPTDRVAPPGVVALAPDGRAVVWSGGSTLVAADGLPAGALRPDSAAGAFTSDGRSYWGLTEADGQGLRAVRWDVSGARPQQVASVSIPPGRAGAAIRLVRNDTVLACFAASELSFWDLTKAEPKLLSRVPGRVDPDSLVFPDGERVLSFDHSVPILWQLREGGWAKVVWAGPVDTRARHAAHPSGRLFALYAQGEITVRRADDGRVVRSIPFGKAPPQRLEFAPDGRHLFVVNGFNTVYVLRIPGLDADPDRAAAEWVLSVGGWMSVSGETKVIRSPADLPMSPFAVVHVTVEYTDRVTDAALSVFGPCAGVEFLNLKQSNVSDAGLRFFANCRGLRELHLTDNPRVTDAGLVYFKGCACLSVLSLVRTGVTDACLADLEGYKELQVLHLDGTKVTDAGLAHLRGLAALKDLNVRKTKVTAKGLESLRAALPGCRIEHDGGITEPKK